MKLDDWLDLVILLYKNYYYNIQEPIYKLNKLQKRYPFVKAKLVEYLLINIEFLQSNKKYFIKLLNMLTEYELANLDITPFLSKNK